MKNRLIILFVFILSCSHSISSQTSNANAEISGMSISAGANYLPFTGKVSNKFTGNPLIGGPTMSIDLYGKKMALFLSMANTTTGKLKQPIWLDDTSWGEGNKAEFYTYSLSVGRVFYSEHQSFRFTPFVGAHLSYLRPQYEGDKRPQELEKFNADGMLSFGVGMNLNYRFTNSLKYTKDPSFCFGLFARVNYIPFAVHKSKFDYSGGAWCFTLGVTLEVFQVQF